MRSSRSSYATVKTARSEKEILSKLLSAMVVCTLLASVVAVMTFPANSAQGAATLPPNFARSQVVGGLASPTAMEFAPDGRLFVAEQRGTLRVVKAGGTLATFVNISGRVDSAGERGLLGVAIDPNFSKNHYVYLYFTQRATGTSPAHNRVIRLTAKGNRARADTEKLILRLNNLSSAKNHNGGAIHFGRDGKLYVAVGENANGANAQSLRNLKGKMLRINKDGTIPQGNPFYDRATGNNRAIWALGLRNPFSFAIQPRTGKMFINDVGEQRWEEINRGAKGANYGWPRYEGPESDPRYRNPVFAYRHGSTNITGCAISGGAFYNPTTRQFPSNYIGDYFFADFCSGWVRKLDSATGAVSGFATGLSRPVDLKVSKNGILYYLSRGSGAGSVGKIRYTGA
ncbi:MAG TPA: PQQ-dependent sugar dehydrogenase [Rubrobacteraceae bacterium]|nr:PQQ-dependent sugar dehydrogenase [Rubrobacteraceae bacterium]